MRIMKLRRLCLLFVLTGGLGALAAAPPSPGLDTERHIVPPIERREAELCARQLDYAARLIAQNYFRDITEPALIGAAAMGLYQAAGLAPPIELQREPGTYYAGRDVVEELTKIRQALGKHEALRGGRDVTVGLNAMLELLDPYSVLDAAENLIASTVDANVQVGLTVEDRADPRQPWIVRSVATGSPADRAGLKPGDALLGFDERELPLKMLPTLFVQSLAAPADTRHKALVRSPGEATPRTITLVYRVSGAVETPLFGRRRLDADSWDYWLDARQRIAYLRCGYLTQELEAEFFQVLRELRQQGMTGLVLDLRDCQGGFLKVAKGIADAFLDKGQSIARIRYGNRSTPANVLQNEVDRGEYLADGPPVLPREVKVVILVGPDTMGGGELVAAALQDNHRAVVIGQRTRGKGTVQTTFNDIGLDQTRFVSLRLSTGVLVRPSGQALQRLATSGASDPWGVRPNEGHELRISAELARQIRRWRHDYERRQFDNRVVLPLDMPQNDPVLAAALKHLQSAPKPEF